MTALHELTRNPTLDGGQCAKVVCCDGVSTLTPSWCLRAFFPPFPKDEERSTEPDPAPELRYVRTPSALLRCLWAPLVEP